VVSLDPYPLSEPSLELEVWARRVEDRRYASAEEAASAYHGAESEPIKIQVGPA